MQDLYSNDFPLVWNKMLLMHAYYIRTYPLFTLNITFLFQTYFTDSWKKKFFIDIHDVTDENMVTVFDIYKIK